MAAPTNWTPGLIALGVSLGSAALFFVTRARSLAKSEAVSLDDLETRYQRLLSELKELKANQHLMESQHYAAEQSRLESAATQCLKEKLSHSHDRAKAAGRAERKASAPPSFLGRYPGLVGAVVGGSVVAFFAYLAYSLTLDAKPAEGMAQRPPAANQPPAAAASDGKIEALLSKVRETPTDVDVLGDAAIALMRRQAFEEARPFVMRGSALDPYHAKMRVGRAVLSALDGDMLGALTALETVSSRYPEAFDGRMFAGMIALDQNDQARALRNFDAYLAAAPPQDVPPMLRAAVADIRKQAPAAP